MSETKMYSVLDKWTDLDKENVVDFTSVDGVVTEARLNGVPVGGGGGGDLDTVKVTITELSGKVINIAYAISFGEQAATFGRITDAGEYDAITYKGTCIAELDAIGYILTVVSGSAEVADNMAIITGPCTLSVVPH